jgi:hypothetical protein
MQVSLEQDSKLDNVRDSLAMNITMLSQPGQAGTAVLSGINVFEGCITVIEGNCTILPRSVPGAYPIPCVTPEIPLNFVSHVLRKQLSYFYIALEQAGKYTLDVKCIRSAGSRAADFPLVGILYFGHNDFDEAIVGCQCYVIVEDNANNPLEHNVTCGIQVTRCAMPQNITAQFVP